MSDMTGLPGLVSEIREASRNIEVLDSKHKKRLDSIEASVNELYKRTGRPGFMAADDDGVAERKSAIGQSEPVGSPGKRAGRTHRAHNCPRASAASTIRMARITFKMICQSIQFNHHISPSRC
jgi:hypothetical protein